MTLKNKYNILKNNKYSLSIINKNNNYRIYNNGVAYKKYLVIIFKNLQQL